MSIYSRTRHNKGRYIVYSREEKVRRLALIEDVLPEGTPIHESRNEVCQYVADVYKFMGNDELKGFHKGSDFFWREIRSESAPYRQWQNDLAYIDRRPKRHGFIIWRSKSKMTV